MQKVLQVFIGLLLFNSIFIFHTSQSLAFDIDTLKAIQGLNAKADSFEYIGDNMVAYGNIFVRKGDIIFYADKAIVNNTNKNIEISGNVSFYNLVRSRQQMEYWDVRKLEKDPNVKIQVVGTVMTPSGRQILMVDTIKQVLTWHGDRAMGNLITGVFEFGTFQANLGGWTVVGDKATRKADGEIVIKDASISPCSSYLEGHSVYSLNSSEVNAFPSGGDVSSDGITTLNSGVSNLNKYHFWAYNNVLYIGSMPVFWLPIMYKPPPNRMGNWAFTYGNSTQLGGYLRTSNNWDLWDTPDLKIGTSNLLDYYSIRGFGYGNATEVTTPNSVTQSFLYGINDNIPDYSAPDNSRFKPFNPYRYDVDVRNFTHLNDRLDFRGRFAKISDEYFLYDYFGAIASIDPAPSTYANLDYQFDWGALSANLRPQTYTWYTTAQELPKLQLTIPRRELFANIYHQGQTQVSYLNQRWTEFNNPRPGNLPNPANYSGWKIDTVNFAYYPIQMDVFNLIPRAGFRLTGYNKSSNTAVSDTDLNNMIAVSQPESTSAVTFNNYDTSGGSDARFIPEFGMNLNTKASQSWEGVKNAFWDMNGVRHVTTPYVDYTFLQPSKKRDHILYFDDIDRIDTQNFVRTGIDNRLQTRRGGWKSSQAYTWAQMHNYLDFLFDTDSRKDEPNGSMKNLGDFGNVIKITPTQDLTLSSQILVDAGRMVGSNFDTCLTSFNTIGTWTFADGWGFTGSYYSSTDNNTNSTYSMGSLEQQIQSGTFFQRMYQRSSFCTTGLNFKINDRTRGSFNIQYDFFENMYPGAGVTLTRDLPCNLQVILNANASQKTNNNSNGQATYCDFSASLQFTATPAYEIIPRESLFPNDVIEEPHTY